MPAQLDGGQRDALREPGQGAVDVLLARNGASFYLVWKKNIGTRQGVCQAAVPGFLGIVIGIERNRQPIFMRQVEQGWNIRPQGGLDEVRCQVQVPGSRSSAAATC